MYTYSWCRSEHSMSFVSACLSVDPAKRPTTEELTKAALFCHDSFSAWFVTELSQKLQEEFSSNPLLKTRKNIPSASKIKGAAEEILNRRNSEKSSLVKILSFSSLVSQILFDDLFSMPRRRSQGQ